MQIEILFDKDTLDKNLHTGWGVSFLVDGKVLFDTGENGEWLLDNMKRLNVDLDKIEAVVISHDHWDHKDGLWDVLKKRPGLKVYACPGFSKGFKEKVKGSGGRLIEVSRFTNITDEICTTGEIPGRYGFMPMPEQALVIKASKGLIVLTGCAHPGIIKMIEVVKENIPSKTHLVLGGFHLMDKSEKTIKDIISRFRKLDVENVGPTHCTGEHAIGLFKQAYASDFVDVKVGQVIKV